MSNPDEETHQILAEREAFMVPPHGDFTPQFRKAHFIQPIYNPNNESLHLPKPPSASSLPTEPNLKTLKKLVKFRGWTSPHQGWATWVGKIQKTHEVIWKKVGIFDAIRASTYTIKRHTELIISLAEKWSPQTNTFVFPWGEVGITLEDVMILGGFSVLGDCVSELIQKGEYDENEGRLVDVYLAKKKKNLNGIVLQSEWMEYFVGVGGELEHLGFLVLWLSRFVFSTKYCSKISPHVFPIAISLGRGTRLALASAILASIYNDLSLLKEKIVDFVDDEENNCSQLELWAPFQLVQMWVWERFPMSGPKPIALRVGEPRLARWNGVERPTFRRFGFSFEPDGKHFVWRPYAVSVKNWQFPEFYSEEGRLVALNSEAGEEMLSFGTCLRVCELVGLDCSEQYYPHRVGMQFGMDQDIPCSNPKLNECHQITLNSTSRLMTGPKLYVPSRLFQGGITLGYSDWWKGAICSLEDNFLWVYSRRRPTPRYVEFSVSENDLDESLDQNSDENEQLCDQTNGESNGLLLDFPGKCVTEQAPTERNLSVGQLNGNKELISGADILESEAILSQKPIEPLVNQRQYSDSNAGDNLNVTTDCLATACNISVASESLHDVDAAYKIHVNSFGKVSPRLEAIIMKLSQKSEDANKKGAGPCSYDKSIYPSISNADIERGKNSHNHPSISDFNYNSDVADNTELHAFELRHSKLDGRIRNLERVVSEIKAVKLSSKAR